MNHSFIVSSSATSCIIHITNLSPTRFLWLCLFNLLVTAETLITVTGSSVTFKILSNHL